MATPHLKSTRSFLGATSLDVARRTVSTAPIPRTNRPVKTLSGWLSIDNSIRAVRSSVARSAIVDISGLLLWQRASRNCTQKAGAQVTGCATSALLDRLIGLLIKLLEHGRTEPPARPLGMSQRSAMGARPNQPQFSTDPRRRSRRPRDLPDRSPGGFLRVDHVVAKFRSSDRSRRTSPLLSGQVHRSAGPLTCYPAFSLLVVTAENDQDHPTQHAADSASAESR